MADYEKRYGDIRAAGANVAAISVDAPQVSDRLRVRLALPFPLLSDSERAVVKAWGLYNAREKGGIARPAIFVIDRERTVRYAAVDSVARRVPADEILRVLRTGGEKRAARSRVFVPRLTDWLAALRNALHRVRKHPSK